MSHSLLNSIILTTGLVNVATAIYLMFSKRRTKASVIFAFFCLEVALWNFVNYLAFTTQDVAILVQAHRFSILPPVLIAPTLLYFTLIFTNTKYSKLALSIMFLPMIILMLMIFTPWNVSGYSGTPSNNTFIPGPLYIVFSIYFIIYLTIALVFLIKQRLLTHFQIERRQLNYIIFGLLTSAVCGIVFSVILPLYRITYFDIYGNVASVVFTICSTYAITRYRLFGVYFLLRSALTKLLAVLILIVLFSGLYIYLDSLMQSFFLSSYLNLITVVVLAILAVKPSYQWLQKMLLDMIEKIVKIKKVSKKIAPPPLVMASPMSASLNELIIHYCNLNKDTEVSVYLYNQKLSAYVAIYPAQHQDMLQLDHLFISYLQNQSDIIIMEELLMDQKFDSDPLAEAALTYMNRSHIIAAIPLRNQAILLGFTFIKARHDLPSIAAEDAIQLQKFQFMSIPLMQSMALLHWKNN